MASLAVGAAWVSGVCACAWLTMHDHPVIGVVVLLAAMSAHTSKS